MALGCGGWNLTPYSLPTFHISGLQVQSSPINGWLVYWQHTVILTDFWLKVTWWKYTTFNQCILYIQGGFFYCSALKMTKCQTHWKIWHLELFWWDLQCNLTLSHFLGRNSKKTTLYKGEQFLPKLVCRLGDQLDVKKRAIVNLKQEISARDEMIKSCQEKLLKHSNSQVYHGWTWII